MSGPHGQYRSRADRGYDSGLQGFDARPRRYTSSAGDRAATTRPAADDPNAALPADGDADDPTPSVEVRSVARPADMGREWRGAARQHRLRRLPVILALGLSGSIIAIAFTGPRLAARPNLDLSYFATPTPSATESPTPSHYGPPPTPTPLPRLTYGQGERPTAAVLLDVGQGLQRFEPSTGFLSDPLATNIWENAFIRSSSGGYVCLCMSRSSDGMTERLDTSIARVDDEGRMDAPVKVASYTSTGILQDNQASTSVDVDTRPDAEVLYVATGFAGIGSWTIHVDAIDARTRTKIAGTDVIRLPLPETDPKIPKPSVIPGVDPPQAWPNGPGIRLAPDGRHLVVWGWIDRYDPALGDPQPVDARAWIVDVDPDAGRGRFGRVHEFGSDLADQVHNCGLADWIDETRLATACQADGSNGLRLQIFGQDGKLEQAGDIVPNDEGWGGEMLFDLAAKRIWMWDSLGHRLSWLDVPDGTVRSTVVDPKLPPGPVGGAPTLEPRPATWTDAGSAMWRSSWSVVGSPDGSRIFALGRRNDAAHSRGPQGSTGIWVFDARTGALVDHWLPVASYVMIAVSHDASWVMAVGEPEADADGNPTGWTASLSFHRIDTGEVGLRLSGFSDPQSWVNVLP